MEKKKEDSQDFDGHTDFQKLSAEEKLLWLSQVAQFASEFKGSAKKSKNTETT
jgi:hypothetical protein